MKAVLQRLRHWWQAPAPVTPWHGVERPDSDRVLRVLMRNLEGMLFRCAIDPDWTFLFVSDGAQRLTGYRPAELTRRGGISLELLTHPLDREHVRDTIMAAIRHHGRYRVEYRIRCRDGAEKWVMERGSCIPDGRGGTVLEGFIEDISDQVLSQMRRTEAELRYRSIFAHSVVGMFQTSVDGHYLAANQALADLYGYASPDALIEGLADIAHRLYVDSTRREEFARQIEEHGVVRDFESEVYRVDGSRIWISENAHAVRSPEGELLYYEGTVEDISERRRHQEELQYQATHDPLTGLPNRHLLNDRLHQALAVARRSGRQVVVAFVDLDNFKVINDGLGHAAGDRLLQAIAERLQKSLRAADTVARYGGDEFVLILCDQQSIGDLACTLSRIQEAICQPVLLDGHQLHVGSSIGASVYPGDAEDPPSLLRYADAAMYHAKIAGKGQFQYYTPELNAAAHERLEMEAALRRAIEQEELSVHYQPKVDGKGQIRGCEALVRWNSPELGLLSPVRFIPLAEETGLIRPITGFVLRTACHDAARWRAAGWDDLHVAVNISARHFAADDLVQQVSDVLAESGLPAEQLQLEITESMLVGDVDRTVGILTDLKALGVRIAIDDFGTGYSSLAYLKRLPIDVLKIDRSFVTGCHRDADAIAIPRTIALLGQSLGMDVVAEGVEEADEHTALVEQGCVEFQGYHFSRPLPEAAFASLLERSRGSLPVAPAG